MHDEGSNQGGVQGVHKEAGNSGARLQPDGLVEDSREGFPEVKPVLEGSLLLPSNFSFRRKIIQHGRADLHPTEVHNLQLQLRFFIYLIVFYDCLTIVKKVLTG